MRHEVRSIFDHGERIMVVGEDAIDEEHGTLCYGLQHTKIPTCTLRAPRPRSCQSERRDPAIIRSRLEDTATYLVLRVLFTTY